MLLTGQSTTFDNCSGRDALMPKIRRIGLYLEVLAELEKLPSLFRNVVALSTVEFDALFA